jgi:hypothetical protein
MLARSFFDLGGRGEVDKAIRKIHWRASKNPGRLSLFPLNDR